MDRSYSAARRIVTLAGVFMLAALMAVGLGAVSSPSHAQQAQVECPAGFTPSADGTQCLSDSVDDNVVTTTSCTQGVLSADGQFCIVPRLDAAPADAAPAADLTAPVPIFTG